MPKKIGLALASEETRKRVTTLGGNATASKHGREHFVNAGKLGGAVTLQKYGKEHYQKMGSLGGKATAKKEK